MLANHETKSSPQPFSEENGTRTPMELTSAIGVLIFPEGLVIDDKLALRRDLVAEVRFENGKYVAIDYQVDEYGIGESIKLAEEDLLGSLVDYLESLERRENRLARRERDALQVLRNLLARR
jgi:hypothetical protein